MKMSHPYGPNHEMRVRIFFALREMVCGEGAVPLDSVKVTDICEKAGISRRTFYNHFEDKHSIVSWFMDLTGAESYGQIGLTLSLEDGIRRLVYTVEPYRDFLAAASRSKYYGMTYTQLARTSRRGLEQAAEAYLGEAISESLRLTIRYYASIPEAVITDWSKGVISCTAEEAADLILSLTPDHLIKLFEKPTHRGGFIPGMDMMKAVMDPNRSEPYGVSGSFHVQPDGTYLSVR